MPHPEITSSGRILWTLISENTPLRQKLLLFCEEKIERGRYESVLGARAYENFLRVCSPTYRNFLLILAELLEWDSEAEPGIVEFGAERVKGTQERMPEEGKPRTKFDALLDSRSCFNAIRRGFLEYRGRNLSIFKQHMEGGNGDWFS